MALDLAPEEEACLDARMADPIGCTLAGDSSFRIPEDTAFAAGGFDVAVLPAALQLSFLIQCLIFGTRWLAPSKTNLSCTENWCSRYFVAMA